MVKLSSLIGGLTMPRSLTIRKLKAVEVRHLHNLLEGQISAWQKRRAEAILLHAIGMNAVEITQVLEAHPNTVYADLRAFNQHGLNSIQQLLTSNQMGITEKEAIESLLDIGAEIKVFVNPNQVFHPKAYIFKGTKRFECIIGSSNLSRSALFDGVEWNLHFDSSNPAYCNLEDNFDRIWDSSEAQLVTKEDLQSLFIADSDQIMKRFVEKEDAVGQTLLRTLTEIIENNACYPVSKRPDGTTTWKFNLSVNKVNTFLKKKSFYVIVRCDYESPDEIVFAIPSQYLSMHIFPYANQGRKFL
jgi:phospholipase D-like protein